jgi:hypothetical protein
LLLPTRTNNEPLSLDTTALSLRRGEDTRWTNVSSKVSSIVCLSAGFSGQ